MESDLSKVVPADTFLLHKLMVLHTLCISEPAVPSSSSYSYSDNFSMTGGSAPILVSVLTFPFTHSVN